MLAHMLAAIGPPWLGHPLGVCVGHHAEYEKCRGYNFWSGIGSDISEIAIAGGILTLVLGACHHVNCHERGCWRVSWHKDEDGHPKCAKHHPEHPSEGFFRNILKRLGLRAPTPGPVRFHYRKPSS